MKKWIAKMCLNRAWKPRAIAVPVLRGRALAVKKVVDSLLEKLDDGELDEAEQATLVEEMLDAIL